MTGIRRGSQVLTIGLVTGGLLLFAAFAPIPLPTAAYAQEAFNSNPRSAQEAIDMLVMANRILSSEGIFDAYGHVSIRNPENPKTFFIARAVAPEQVTKKDILEVDFEGNVVTQTTMKPYQERIIHASIYKVRPDVNSVIHAHPEPIIAFSISDVPLRPIRDSKFCPSVPVYDEYDFVSPGNTGMLVTTKDQGERLARRLGSGLAVLMRGHGYTVVGSTLPGAVANAISLRDNAVILLMAVQLGEPKYLSAEECKEAATSGGNPDPGRAWNAWVQRVKKAMPDMK